MLLLLLHLLLHMLLPLLLRALLHLLLPLLLLLGRSRVRGRYVGERHGLYPTPQVQPGQRPTSSTRLARTLGVCGATLSRM